jgi:hypothetical protein
VVWFRFSLMRDPQHARQRGERSSHGLCDPGGRITQTA